jgi:peptide/nickel transport system ATP-binding protein
VPLLAVDDLRISLPTPAGLVPLVHGLSFTLDRGHTLGLIGESGSGKSLTALALMGLLPAGAQIAGSVALDGVELLGLSEAQWCALRGRRMAMVFQEPMSALNPLQAIGQQVAEALLQHRRCTRSQARAEALRLLDRVQLPRAAQRLGSHPHELSGGQRQRVLIAAALAGGPELLIADEPTTALDASVQREVLDLIAQLVREDGMGLLLISHDLGVMADRVQDLLVLQAGRAVERGPTARVLAQPEHPHTQALVAARPRLRAWARAPAEAVAPPAPAPDRQARTAGEPPPLLVVQNLSRQHALPRTGWLRQRPGLQALDGVSFTLAAGHSLGVVGESGSGKTTLARLVMALDTPSQGRVMLKGQDLHQLAPPALRGARRHLQMVFQDPYGSLDPRRTVGQTVAEPLAVLQGAGVDEQQRRCAEVLRAVGLQAADADRYPHAFSGGQRQRIAIARALVTRPGLIVADEPVSALDMRTRAQVLDLLQALQREHGLALLLISHDLAVVDRLCGEVLVLDQGRIVEQGSTAQLFSRPRHAVTQRLLDAVPGRPRAA